MPSIEYKGFEGIRIAAEITGNDGDPLVLLIHSAGQTRDIWKGTADALVKAGRQVVNIDLRGHGESDWPAAAHYEVDAFAQDIRVLLSQLNSRPVVVAARLGGWAAITALESDASKLVSGLVLVDLPSQLSGERSSEIRSQLKQKIERSGKRPHWDVAMLDTLDASIMPERLKSSAPNIDIPVSFIRGALFDDDTNEQANEFVKLIPNAEFSEIDSVSRLVEENRMEDFNGLLVSFLERKHPREPEEYRGGAEPNTLRSALGSFATGVTVVTAFDEDNNPIGITANSFTSLSLDPPLLLVCIGNNSYTGGMIRKAEKFAINVLQIGQQPTSNIFASKKDDRFSEVEWVVGESGVPVLSASLSSFECERHEVHEGGDHFILVGKVTKAQYDLRRDPLLFFRGKYRRIHFT